MRRKGYLIFANALTNGLLFSDDFELAELGKDKGWAIVVPTFSLENGAEGHAKYDARREWDSVKSMYRGSGKGGHSSKQCFWSVVAKMHGESLHWSYRFRKVSE